MTSEHRDKGQKLNLRELYFGITDGDVLWPEVKHLDNGKVEILFAVEACDFKRATAIGQKFELNGYKPTVAGKRVTVPIVCERAEIDKHASEGIRFFKSIQNKLDNVTIKLRKKSKADVLFFLRDYQNKFTSPLFNIKEEMERRGITVTDQDAWLEVRREYGPPLIDVEYNKTKWDLSILPSLYEGSRITVEGMNELITIVNTTTDYDAYRRTVNTILKIINPEDGNTQYFKDESVSAPNRLPNWATSTRRVK